MQWWWEWWREEETERDEGIGIAEEMGEAQAEQQGVGENEERTRRKKIHFNRHDASSFPFQVCAAVCVVTVT